MPPPLPETMREPSPLHVQASELLARPGTSKAVRVRTPLEGLSGQMAAVEEGAELSLDLRLDSLAEGIEVRGTLGTTLRLQCSRCLRDVRHGIEVPVHELYLLAGSPAASEDTYEITDDTVDLEPLVRDAIVLALPLKPLCREDCRGLCPTCGADRNTTDCGHEAAPADLRWNALEDLRERLEG